MTVVVTIDGPAGAGKSTVAKRIAQRLDYYYLDTGAMYRALTLKAMRKKVDLEDESVLVALAKKTSIDFAGKASQGLRIMLDQEDVSEAIRTPEVTNNTFYIARAPRVRAVMVELQRKIGAKQNIVVEGRDVGTVVFPKAQFKFYLDANFVERAQRRIKELEEKGKKVDHEELKKELQERDQKDFTRSTGPLKKAEDAIIIDSTFLSVDQTAEKLLEYIQKNPKKMQEPKAKASKA